MSHRTITDGERRRPDRAAGFSLVEVLIAATLVLFIALGVLPLFIQSMRSNLWGQDATNAANHARSRLERFYQQPFTSAELDIVAGTERQFDEYYSHDLEEWVDGTLADVVPPDQALWVRRTIIRQYNINEFTEAQEEDRDPIPLPAGTPGEQIHLKEIEVFVESTRLSGPLGAGKSLAIRAYKSS